jgi:hypothetical protein
VHRDFLTSLYMKHSQQFFKIKRLHFSRRSSHSAGRHVPLTSRSVASPMVPMSCHNINSRPTDSIDSSSKQCSLIRCNAQHRAAQTVHRHTGGVQFRHNLSQVHCATAIEQQVFL